MYEFHQALLRYSRDGDERRLINDLMMAGDMFRTRKLSGVQLFSSTKIGTFTPMSVSSLPWVSRYSMTRWQVFVDFLPYEVVIIIIADLL